MFWRLGGIDNGTHQGTDQRGSTTGQWDLGGSSLGDIGMNNVFLAKGGGMERDAVTTSDACSDRRQWDHGIQY